MIKPDGVQRGLIGAIVSRFEAKGYKLVGLKMATPTKAHLEKHYADLATKPFFPSLIEYMAAGPVICMVWEGSHAVKIGRVLLGETNPSDSTPGSIRGDYCESDAYPRDAAAAVALAAAAPRWLCLTLNCGRCAQASRSAATSATAATPLSPPRPRSPSGSRCAPKTTDFVRTLMHCIQTNDGFCLTGGLERLR